MTYEEKYMQCKSFDELSKMVVADIAIAQSFNADRVPIIKKSAEKVINEKFHEAGEQDEI